MSWHWPGNMYSTWLGPPHLNWVWRPKGPPKIARASYSPAKWLAIGPLIGPEVRHDCSTASKCRRTILLGRHSRLPDPYSGSLSIWNKLLYKAAADSYHPALIITTPSNCAKDLFVLGSNYLTFIFLPLPTRSSWARALLLIDFYSASVDWSRRRSNSTW